MTSFAAEPAFVGEYGRISVPVLCAGLVAATALAGALIYLILLARPLGPAPGPIYPPPIPAEHPRVVVVTPTISSELRLRFAAPNLETPPPASPSARPRRATVQTPKAKPAGPVTAPAPTVYTQPDDLPADAAAAGITSYTPVD